MPEADVAERLAGEESKDVGSVCFFWFIEVFYIAKGLAGSKRCGKYVSSKMLDN